jgi:uncharacterized protein (DUF697 family)/GTPase Era involved in 16S rRNA processing
MNTENNISQEQQDYASCKKSKSNKEILMNTENNISQEQQEEIQRQADTFAERFEEISDKTFAASLKEYNEGMPKLNIIVIGKTGAGKSTLINAIFGEDLAQTGSGAPVTEHCDKYTTEGYPLTIYDSKGLESLDNTDTQNELLELIKSKNLSGNPQENIHICWYCVLEPGGRFEPKIEPEIINKMREHIPVIIVATQAMGGTKTEAFRRNIEENFKDKPIDIVSVMALEKMEKSEHGETKVNSHGLNDLVDRSYLLLPESQKKTFVARQKIAMELKRENANKIAYIYSAAVAAAAFQPFMVADAPIMIGIQVAMMAHIASYYGLSLSDGVLAKTATSIVSTLGKQLSKILLVSLLKVIPGPGTIVAGGINATIGAMLTFALAKAYIEVLARNIDTKEIGGIIDEVDKMMKNTDLKAIKKEWKEKIAKYSAFDDEAKKIAEDIKKKLEK